MDLEAFESRNAAAWTRLDALTRRRRLDADEADELVALHGITATHLSRVRSGEAVPDPRLTAGLSRLLARSRTSMAAPPPPPLAALGRFFRTTLPAALWTTRWWSVGAALGSLLVAVAMGVHVAVSPDVQAALGTPDELAGLTAPGGDFETYYSSDAASAFAFEVWTNNAWLAAQCLVSGVLLGLPVLLVLWGNALNLGVNGGLMHAAGRDGAFFGLIVPHGLLELTAVFVAAGIGLRVGWAVVAPGRLDRATSVARAGRTAVAVALGLAVVLLVSGVIEGFVTPSGLPTWARIGVGVVAEALFLAYVVLLGRPAAAAGASGDVEDAGASRIVAG